ncbi:MAG: aminotransferase class I/II-fold pyridoxal phosphate-dependent enzyme, partial [Halobacteriota archaeon]|nr:aminotransferase class I/II-fold pyridoxal phosphate-dependent enzyme [Halobacteriota archaeon]
MYSERINKLPPYLFSEIDEATAVVVSRGVDVIDLGVGDPDLPTPDHIIESLYVASKNPENHRYPSYTGMLSFREAACEWYKETKGVNLDPKKEAIALIGSKEGIAHI